MQYLLSEDEFNQLRDKARIGAQCQDKTVVNLTPKQLQALCTEIANTLPVVTWKSVDPEPWGCMLTDDDEWYCDECPVQKLCPCNKKSWSK